MFYVPYRLYYGDVFGKIKFVDLLGNKKCYVKFHKCDGEIIDGWSFIRIIMYLIFGYLYPGEYTFIFISSVGIEIGEYLIHLRPKFILDPLINMVSYGIGHLLHQICA